MTSALRRFRHGTRGNRLLSGVVWTHVVRGTALMLLGAASVIWPEAALPVSMRAAGVVVALTGLADVALGVRLRSTFRGWPLLAGNGLACVAFGILTIALGRVPAEWGLGLTALWLLLYGLVAGLLAVALWPLSRTRSILAGVAVAFIATAAVARSLVGMPPFVTIYLGALFAVLLGTLHVAAGLWIRRVVVPEFSSTTQSAWMPEESRAAGTHGPGRSSDPSS